MLARLLNFATDKIHNLPIIVMMPHSRCNCRCVMCDIWKANQAKKEITTEVLERHVMQFKKLGVREIVFSGGEPLMHSNLWALCSLLRKSDIELTLLSTGLLLEKNAEAIVENFKEVIISLDGSQPVHDKIRNIPQAFERLASGVAELREKKSSFRITGRCVLQRSNYHDFVNTVQAALAIGLDQISFLAADVSTSAFNHLEQWTDERVGEVALTREETLAFEKIIKDSFSSLKEAYDSKLIAESPGKMLKIVQYYKAVNGLAEFVAPGCNAPWVSAVIESDGRIMPCFFHESYGNLYDGDFEHILNSEKAIAFRKNLNIDQNPVCRKCVCSLKLGLRQFT